MTTTMSGSRLPVEIIMDQVIDYLRYRKKSLSACALASRTLFRRSYHHLLAEVDIHSSTSKEFLRSIASKKSYTLQFARRVDLDLGDHAHATPKMLAAVFQFP